ncbi:MAG TPA: hypothetical protein VG712_03130 [Gemmatimonadales bacterium]|nr:hypothetical protein [Gemmatimonadales bacterium]
MRASRILAPLFLAALALSSRPLAAQREWTGELFAGTAFNAHTPLTIWQTGQPDIHFIAHYDTKPWYRAKYYAFRVARWNGNKAWALDFTHHKIYLTNNPPEVQQFQISHGYNLLHLSRLWRTHGWILSGGAGIVVTHPENTVRNQQFYPESGGTLGGGYYLDGVSILGAVGRQVKISGPLFATGLGKITLSNVTTRVMDGGAEVPNVAAHINIGLGVKF